MERRQRTSRRPRRQRGSSADVIGANAAVIGITGASGFIGNALLRAARRRLWAVVPLPRTITAAHVEGCDAVMHLAGERVDGRWTAAKKHEIERSRVEGTRALVDAIGAANRKPRVLVSASAVGYYGDRGDEALSEGSAPGNDFLARVCVQWEREAKRVEQYGVRAVWLRTGIVFGSGGGALPKMMKPFRFGAGGPLGNGRQFVPWIHLHDIVALYVHAFESAGLAGPVNAVAPDYVTNARLTRDIGAAMHRPAFLPAPSFALHAALGEFAGTLTASQLVIPQRALEAGFQWRYPRLQDALRDLIRKR